LVDGSGFGGLRDGDDFGLHVMFVADAVIGVANQVDIDLAVLRLDRDELAAGKFLGRTTFIAVNVGGGRANHGLVRAG
jgi:hypothetical protein